MNTLITIIIVRPIASLVCGVAQKRQIPSDIICFNNMPARGESSRTHILASCREAPHIIICEGNVV